MYWNNDIKTLNKFISHRYPFALIDRIVRINNGVSISAIKNVTRNEYFFQGHFPEKAIMPGVLILEALAQASGILMYNDKSINKPPYLVGLEKVRFKTSICPGNTMILYSKFKRKIKNAHIFKGMAFIANRIACEAEIILV